VALLTDANQVEPSDNSAKLSELWNCGLRSMGEVRQTEVDDAEIWSPNCGPGGGDVRTSGSTVFGGADGNRA